MDKVQKLELIRPLAERHGMSVHQLACQWLLADAGVTSITGTFLDRAEIAEACATLDKPRLSSAELRQLGEDYSRDWGLGDDAHPCDLKSSRAAGGAVRSGYVPPPILIA